MNGKKLAKYLAHEIIVDSDATIDEVQDAMAEIFPEVAHAECRTDTDGNLTFTVVAGTKGR